MSEKESTHNSPETQYTVRLGTANYVEITTNQLDARYGAAARHKASMRGPDIGEFVSDIADVAEIVAEKPATVLPAATDELLSFFDVILLDQEDLDAFVESSDGGFEQIAEAVDVFTDDDFTAGKVKFNLILGADPHADVEYGIATQLSDPFFPEDRVADLRRRRNSNSFADWVVGLTA